MTVEISVWSVIGWTLELLLVLTLLIVLRLWVRLGRAMKTMTEDQGRASRLAREKFGQREG